MKAGKQRKNVFKILGCPTYNSILRENINQVGCLNAAFQTGKISEVLFPQRMSRVSERVILGEGERNGIQEAECPGQEGGDQVPLDDDEGSPWGIRSAADLERNSQD